MNVPKIIVAAWLTTYVKENIKRVFSSAVSLK